MEDKYLIMTCSAEYSADNAPSNERIIGNFYGDSFTVAEYAVGALDEVIQNQWWVEDTMSIVENPYDSEYEKNR